MPQPIKHTPDAMLDAARTLILGGGPSAGSARAVAMAVGAPSGSVYHRFPRRDDLVAAAWLRAQDRFLDAYLTALAGTAAGAGAAAAAAGAGATAGAEAAGAEAAGAGVDAAVAVLTWSAANPQDAALLLRYALADLLRGEVSAGLAEHAADNDRRLRAAITRIAEAADRPLTEVLLAVVDLPYAVSSRILRDGRAPTEDDVRALRRAASLLLGVRST